MKRFSKISLNRQVLFTGSYGRLNTGDDAFCAIAAWGARHYWKTKRVHFLCQQIPQLPVPGKAVLSANPLFAKQQIAEVFYRVITSPTIIFAGGSIFHDVSGKRNRLLQWLNQFDRLKLGAIGVSLGPYKNKNARKEVEIFLKRFSFLVLRDRTSFEDAMEMDLPFRPVEGFDLAALLPDVYGQAKILTNKNDSQASILGVSVCHYERYVDGDVVKEQRREERLLATLKMVAKASPVRIRFLVFNGHESRGDLKLTKQFASALSTHCKTEIVPYSQDPVTMWHKIGECSVVLATRLHAGIFSCIAGIPFLQVEYHQKCSDFLEEINCPKRLRVGDMEMSPQELGSVLMAIVNNQTKPFLADLIKLKEKANRNFTGYRG